MLRRADRRFGLSTIELMIAMSVSSLILGTVGGVFVATARAVTVVNDQQQRQTEAGMALDRMSEILRNGVFPVNIVSTTEVRFVDARNPSDIASIWLDGQSVMYNPDIDDPDTAKELAGPVDGLEISVDPDPLIGGSALYLQISYNYMSFRDYYPDESRNATFVTSVFMRNTQ
jgi:hypothetical protein